MMICPACNYELLPHNDYCENCGAPAYLVTASQPMDVTHCTYCGARDESGSGDCATCGLKKNFKTSESLIGTCRNCGVAWRNVWMYCQTCGVARENGLVDTALPFTVSFQPDRHSLSTSGQSFQPAHSHHRLGEQYEVAPDLRDLFFTASDFDPMTEPELPPLLSEHEVVERMYASSEEETTPQRKADLDTFFSESEIADSRQPTALTQINQAEERVATEPPVIYELPLAANHEPAIPASIPAAPIYEPPPVVTATRPKRAETRPEPAASITASTQELNGAPPTRESLRADTTSTAKTAAKPATGPVQTVRVIHRSRTPTTPQVDKKLVKIIAVLILLVLLFSALIVSGVRLRDLFGKPQLQVVPPVAATPSVSPTPMDAPPAPQGMVFVLGGVFRMGLDEGDTYEAPAHEVTIASFFMDRTEVSNAQYAEFLKATNHAAPPDWKSGKYPVGTADFPVVNVSWQDANDYAAWAGKRLPSEAEWEFAARAKDSRAYPWGSNWDATKANTSESKVNHPVEVTSYADAANPLGLLNLTGNVWEWTAGDVTSYKDSSVTLAPGKVIRGGAFYAPKERATTTFRGFAPPDKQAAGIGFRCVKNAA
jgi:gamma-glutamyl hercynylcysteine S-oxide synthase